MHLFFVWEEFLFTNFIINSILHLNSPKQVDARVSGGLVKQYLVHHRKTVKVISGHPLDAHYYVTGSNDG